MKTFSYLIIVAFLASLPLLNSCKKDDDPVSCNYITELQQESDAVSAAALAYGNNPTPANCEAFKDAYEDYLDAADDYVDCATVAGQGAQLQAAIDAAQQNLDQLQC
jgi:hypothetical protein